MAWFGLWKTRTEKALEGLSLDLSDLKTSITRSPTSSPGEFGTAVKEKRRPGKRDLTLQTGKQKMLSSRRTAGDEVAPVYDLTEVIKFQDLESYFRVSVDRHVEMIMKNGYRLKGKDPEAVKYMKRRLEEIEIISDRPFEDMLRSLVRNTVVTSNGYWVFSRDPMRSTGHRIKMWGKKLNPISAISIPDPATVKVRQNASGRPYAYVQEVPGNQKKKIWQHHDVVHVTTALKDGYSFGTPFIIPTMEDIKALRKLEMLAEHVGHKFAFPLLHWKVGNDKFPAEVTVDPASGTPISEVRMAHGKLEELSQEGFVVTTHRHEVVLVGQDGELFDLKPYIQHYEARVLSGLRVSEVDLGRGDTSNRGTAQVMSQVLVDACTEVQQVIAAYLNMKFFRILQMEGDYNVNPDNRVVFSWPPIDAEAQRAQETHGLNLYVQGGITREELRLEYLERDEISDSEEEGLFLNKHLIPLMEAETKNSIEIEKAKPKPVAGAGGGGASGGGGAKAKASGAKASKRSSSATQPSNQHGKSATKPRVAKNDLARILELCGDQVIKEHHECVGTGLQHDMREIVTEATKEISRVATPAFIDAWEDGYREASPPEASVPPLKTRSLMRTYLETFRQRDLHRFEKSLMISAGISPKDGRFENKASPTQVRPALEVVDVLLTRKLDRGINGAYHLGYLEALKDAGSDHVTMIVPDDKSREIPLNDETLILSLVANPVFLDNCEGGIKIETRKSGTTDA